MSDSAQVVLNKFSPNIIYINVVRVKPIRCKYKSLEVSRKTGKFPEYYCSCSEGGGNETADFGIYASGDILALDHTSADLVYKKFGTDNKKYQNFGWCSQHNYSYFYELGSRQYNNLEEVK